MFVLTEFQERAYFAGKKGARIVKVVMRGSGIFLYIGRASVVLNSHQYCIHFFQETFLKMPKPRENASQRVNSVSFTYYLVHFLVIYFF